jgi:hypothetical protein
MFLPNAALAIRVFLAIALAMPLAQSAVPQQRLTKKELKALTALARTATDHERLAEYYRSEAKRLQAKQQEHERELAEYYKNPARYPGKYPTMGDHCRSLAAYYQISAGKAAAQADMHERLAKGVQ